MSRPAPKSAFKPGQPRPANAGRKKGTPNKKTLEFQQLLEQYDFNPGEELIYIYQEQMKIFEKRKKEKYKNQASMLAALDSAQKTVNDICQYVYPKKKAIEHSGEVGVKNFADFIALGAGHKK